MLISDVAIIERGKPTQLPSDVLCVGRGHFSHRLSVGPWATPFNLKPLLGLSPGFHLHSKPRTCRGLMANAWRVTAHLTSRAMQMLAFHLGHQAGRKGTQKPKQRARRVTLAAQAALMSSEIRVVRGVPWKSAKPH